MTEAAQATLEEILRAFDRECPVPTRSDVDEWCGRHVEHAVGIRGHVDAKLDAFMAFVDEGLDDAPTRRKRTKDPAGAPIDVMRVLRPREGDPDLTDLLEGAGTTMDELARTMDIDVSVLLQLEAGRFKGAVPTQIVHDLADGLAVDPIGIVAAANASRLRPRAWHASKGETVVDLPTCDDLVLAGDMSDARKEYWLRDP
ncbi:hypothetical protein [Lichenibacterium dinghuense]|uniref:hypothetical protein n=1 Tax=Lichenibacterium dinghuense TaxID=2895977 RepID=UPI001F389556|nr:hypothetical protein [Lichenibacterium sp. 6Y81]